MRVYSHSRLSTFKQCPLKFKFHYIEKRETEIEQSIEAFMGSIVHEAIEKLYKTLKFLKVLELKELLDFYEKQWKKSFNQNILIVRKELDEETYFNLGKKYITDFYKRYYPFNQAQTIATETRILIDLDKQGRFQLQGFIDRLDLSAGNVYEIHDYKTGLNLPTQDEIDDDRQLALYSIGIKEAYRDAKKVKLVWHYLAFDKELTSERSDAEIEELKKETLELIEEIERKKEFKSKVSKLCDWCEFRTTCPDWAHLAGAEGLSPKKFLAEDGVKLVNEYAELSHRKKRIEDQMEKIKDTLVEYVETKNLNAVFGSDQKAVVWRAECYKFPGKNDDLQSDLIKLLKLFGKYDEVSQLDTFSLSKVMTNHAWPEELIRKLQEFAKKEKISRIYLSKI